MELGISLLLELSSDSSITAALGLPFLTVTDMRAHVVGSGSNRVKRIILGSRQDDDAVMNSSLLHLDFTSAIKEGSNSSNVFLQIQRPDLVLDLGFIMDLVEFAAPALKVPITISKFLHIVVKMYRGRGFLCLFSLSDERTKM